jgi:endonuclease YncB( thermonuclease family)
MKIFASLLLALSFGCAAETLQGFVSDVHDGDTVKFTSGKEVHKIRLAYIDAPELDQLYGHDSKTSLMQLTRDKRVEATCHSKDRYGRRLCTLLVGSEDINAMQVRRGMAWAYLRYAPKGTTLKGIQAEAMERKRGLWSDPHPEAPWDYRRSRKD